MDQQTLWKYKRAFKLRVKPNSTHEQLVEAVQKHYDQMEVNEKDAIVFFVYSVRNQGESERSVKTQVDWDPCSTIPRFPRLSRQHLETATSGHCAIIERKGHAAGLSSLDLANTLIP